MFGDSVENSMAAPFKCPLSRCSEMVSASLLLSHFVKIHQKDDVDVKEIQEKEKTSLLVAVTGDFLELNRNICLGILLYENAPSNHSNALLSREYESFDGHLPILIMACRGNYVQMFEEDADFVDPEADFLAIWLTTPYSANRKKLSATVTAHNEELTKSLSSLVQVRNASHSQNIHEFMATDTDVLVVNQAFLADISSNGNIFVEVAISENLL